MGNNDITNNVHVFDDVIHRRMVIQFGPLGKIKNNLIISYKQLNYRPGKVNFYKAKFYENEKSK